MISTDHLLLRHPTTEDLLALSDLWRCEKVRAYLGGVVFNEEIAQKICDIEKHWHQKDFGLWAVFEQPFNNLIGLCGLQKSEEGIEVSYMFFPQYWGQGFGLEAVRASLTYGFQILKLDCIIALTQAANASSCRLLEAVGMSQQDRFDRFDAEQVLYKINANDFLELRKKISVRGKRWSGSNETKRSNSVRFPHAP
jgi:ribosomal-protein-alanine N-acetyltransferase